MRSAFTPKGQRRRRQLIEAAAQMLTESGPAKVSMRSVARRGGASLSAMTYYFESSDELLEEAGRVNITHWAERAEKVAEEAESDDQPDGLDCAISLVLDATLPKRAPLLGHYSQLLAAGASDPVTKAYRAGRGRLNCAVSRVLRVAGIGAPAELVISVVDGAAVTALSEGRDVRATARQYLGQLLEYCGTDSSRQPKSSAGDSAGF